MADIRRQAIDVQHNVQERLSIRHARRMRHIVIRGRLGSTKIFHIVSQTAHFSKKKIIEHKMCVLILSTTFAQNIFRFKNE
jgi:hypothetical protein